MHGGALSGTGVFQVWGAQLNPGSAPSDYLPTSGTATVVTTTTTTPVVVGSELDITVTKPGPPTALGDAAAVSVAGPTQASGNVLTNDHDPNGLPLSVVAVNGQAAGVGATIVGQYGSLVLGANGQYQYVLASGQANVKALAPGQTATDVFSYTVSDGSAYPGTGSTITGQNFIIQSEAFDNPRWVRFGAIGSVSANVAAGPLGGAATADQVTLNGGAGGIYYVTPASGQYTFSIWVKLVSGNGAFDLNYYDGVNGHPQKFVATSAWQRVNITFTASGSSSANVAFMHESSQTATGVFQVFGAQLNPGAAMGDYVATTGHIDTVFTPASGSQVAGAQLAVGVSGPDPAAGAALSFAGGNQGVVVDLKSGVWSHALKVLPLGDSITYGWTALDYQQGQTNTENGYRGPLWRDFASQNMLVNFVGPNTSGDATLADQAHAGFPNYRSDQVAALVPGILAASQPDAILLMAGVNDIFQEVSPASHVAASVSAMIASASSASPSTHIYVATLMPINQALDAQAGDAAMVATVNQAIRSTVAQAAAAGLNVSLVDTSSMTLSDIADTVHPTAAGYSKLAQIWYQAILAQQPDSGGTPGGTAHAVSSAVTTATGSEDNDLLIASDRGSVLNGGGGADRLVAGRGSDTLTGGAGSDQFVFGAGDGHAVVADFSQTQADHIELDGFSGLTQFSQLNGHISVSAGSTIIDLSTFGSPTTITLSHFTGTLSASDVWFF
jgi:VCBS repeat-containing protein